MNPFDELLKDFKSNVAIKDVPCLDTMDHMIKSLDSLITIHERQGHDRYVNVLKCLRSSVTLFGDKALDLGVTKDDT